jgi:hypothetical protein
MANSTETLDALHTASGGGGGHTLPFLLFTSPLAEFRRSASGRSMIVAESPPSFVPRGLMVLLVLLQGTVVLAWMLRAWMRARAARRLQLPAQSAPAPTCSPPRSLLDWSILNVTLHTLYYADNIYYPVRYCEPEWLYRAYVLTEMELKFGFFTPLMALAVGAAILITRRLPSQSELAVLSVAKARQLQSVSLRLVRMCGVYACASFLSGLHYVVEPPSSYGATANLTITGSCVAAAALFIDAVRMHRRVKRAASGHHGAAYSTVHARRIQIDEIDAQRS